MSSDRKFQEQAVVDDSQATKIPQQMLLEELQILKESERAEINPFKQACAVAAYCCFAGGMFGIVSVVPFLFTNIGNDDIGTIFSGISVIIVLSFLYGGTVGICCSPILFFLYRNRPLRPDTKHITIITALLVLLLSMIAAMTGVIIPIAIDIVFFLLVSMMVRFGLIRT